MQTKNPSALRQRDFCLLCVFDGLGFADDVDLDLSGVFELGLDLLGKIMRKQDHVVLADLFGLDHDANLAAGLNGVGLFDAREGAGELFELFEPAIDQLAVNLLDNERFEVKAVISLQTIVQQEVCMEKIVDIHKEPLDAVELMKQPGIVGYIVKKEEQLWDIARHFHTTEAEIMETNGLKSADVQQGDKLLIVKKVSEC